MENNTHALLYSLNGKTIAYRSIYTQITGKLTAGVLLSQIVYWSGTKKGGEFYKTNEEFAVETGLSMDEVKYAKKLLIELDIITVTQKSLPRKTYYKLNEEVLVRFLTSEWLDHQQVGGSDTNWSVAQTPTTSESTTKNTTKNTTDTNISRVGLATQKDIREEHRQILDHYNVLFRPKRPSKDISWIKNANYWLNIYSVDEIKLAISNWYKYPHWSKDSSNKNKCELAFLFRTKNKAGECNYIEEMLSMDLKTKSLAEIRFDEEFDNAF